jgi:membrane carboxypeptidase/penicillin-binding protein
VSTQVSGIDAIGLAKACAKDVSHLSLRQGASTITEQPDKDLCLGGNDHSLWRKLDDAATAIRLEVELSKDHILDLCLNEVDFGVAPPASVKHP